MLTKAEKSKNFQSLVITDSQDFKTLLTLKNIMPYLDSTIKEPIICEYLIQGVWSAN